MTVPNTAIRRAFEVKLAAYTSLPAVAWQDLPFPTPPATEKPSPYLKPVLRTGRPLQGEQGADGRWWYTGFYQITICRKSGGGLLAQDTLRDGLCTYFKPQRLPAQSGVMVAITAVEVGPEMQATDWIEVPITIYFKTLSTT